MKNKFNKLICLSLLFLVAGIFTEKLSAQIGGIITYTNGYTIHTFTSSGTFFTPSSINVEYLIVAGGGAGGATNGPTGGGHYNGGGGGAGGMRTGTMNIPANSNYAVIVGTGGTSVTLGTGGDGTPSIFSSITSAGGGGGGEYGAQGNSGGSGGGAGRDIGTTGTGNTPPTVPPQGNDGYQAGGGGGGAGAAATDRDGGPGASSNISGALVYYAGGGGGAEIGATPSSTGGIGGGGNGQNSFDFPGPGTDGTPNTGGGGGAAGVGWASGSGGSGIVIVRYNCILNFSVSSSSSIICVGETVTLSASGATSYNWNTGAIAGTIFVSPNVNSNFSVTGSIQNGCTQSKTITIMVDQCAGIPQTTKNISPLLIYPNPNSGIFEIETSVEEEVIITSVLGQTLQQQYLFSGKNKIDISLLPTGIYFIQLDSQRLKVIKE